MITVRVDEQVTIHGDVRPRCFCLQRYSTLSLFKVKINNIRYADDTVFLAMGLEQLQTSLYRANESERRQEINRKMSKVMLTTKHPKNTIVFILELCTWHKQRI